MCLRVWCSWTCVSVFLHVSEHVHRVCTRVHTRLWKPQVDIGGGGPSLVTLYTIYLAGISGCTQVLWFGSSS